MNHENTDAAQAPSMGLRDWVSEKGGITRASTMRTETFNGAPRLGLGEGRETARRAPKGNPLQWGSETGSRRRHEAGAPALQGRRPSMGLRDWVSEKGPLRQVREPLLAHSFNGAPRLGLGEGTHAPFG